jgi:hypothetical protein
MYKYITPTKARKKRTCFILTIFITKFQRNLSILKGWCMRIAVQANSTKNAYIVNEYMFIVFCLANFILFKKNIAILI